MRRAAIAMGLALSLAACGQATTASTTTSTTVPVPAAATFVVNDLLANDGQIQGCTRMLARTEASPGADIFREDGVETGAKGFIRIDNVLVDVALVSGQSTESGAARTFEDATHATRIVEDLKTGAAHQESDSVEESGTLAITHNGATQAIQVTGGVAC